MAILIGHLKQSESSMKTPKKRKEILAISIEGSSSWLQSVFKVKTFQTSEIKTEIIHPDG